MKSLVVLLIGFFAVTANAWTYKFHYGDSVMVKTKNCDKDFVSLCGKRGVVIGFSVDEDCKNKTRYKVSYDFGPTLETQESFYCGEELESMLE